MSKRSLTKSLVGGWTTFGAEPRFWFNTAAASQQTPMTHRRHRILSACSKAYTQQQPPKKSLTPSSTDQEQLHTHGPAISFHWTAHGCVCAVRTMAKTPSPPKLLAALAGNGEQDAGRMCREHLKAPLAMYFGFVSACAQWCVDVRALAA
jgi:hypothetical protein